MIVARRRPRGDAAAASPTAPSASAAGRLPRRMRFPIAAVLVVGFGILMLAAVSSVLALGLVSGGRNTLDLLNDKAVLALDTVAARIRRQLDPARDQADFVAGLIERGTIDPGSHQRLTDTLRGALAAAPQVTGIAFIDRSGRLYGAARVGDGLMVREEEAPPDQRAMAETAAVATEPFWAKPVWDPIDRQAYLTLWAPVRRDGSPAGALVVAVALGNLSRFVADLEIDTGIRAALLYDPTHVLAHPSLAGGGLAALTVDPELPVPRIDQLGDPGLAALVSNPDPDDVIELGTSGRDAGGMPTMPYTVRSAADPEGEDHILLTAALSGYGPDPWTIVIDAPASEVSGEIERLAMSGAAGVAILLVSVTLALLLGKMISRRIGRLSEAAASLRALDFSGVPTLPDSRFRELAQAAAAFNGMVAGLRWFESYVPKTLILRLIRQGRDRHLDSEERFVTVLFTDIRDFSTVAEQLGPNETAALLNHHFGLIAAAIEGEGGTVDKFIGDAVMAFWGAPETRPDHAACALRAAAMIAAAIKAENRRRRARGEAPIQLRMGLHAGPVVVGNIGSKSRLNYTIVGDTVNTAARIEQFGKTMPEDEVIALASDATISAAGVLSVGGWIPGGEHRLRGRSGRIALWRLVAQAEAAT